MDFPAFREVVEDPSFYRDLQDLWGKYGRDLMEEVKRCIDWNLSRDPLRYDPVPGYAHHYILKTTEIDSGILPVPSFRVVLRYDENKDPNRVFLVNIENVPASGEED